MKTTFSTTILAMGNNTGINDMLPQDQPHPAPQTVLECQQQFWSALQHKDADLLAHVLADEFVCCSPTQEDQQRSAFIATITRVPLTILHVSAEQVAVHHFGTIAVLIETQVARLRLPDGSEVDERLALSNVFRQTDGLWQMLLAHPVTLPGSR